MIDLDIVYSNEEALILGNIIVGKIYDSSVVYH